MRKRCLTVGAQPTSLYQALQPNEIRLITLQPNTDFSAPIELNLQTTNLDDRPVYKALSYVWGSVKDTSTVIVNGQAVKATTNLVSALRHIRQNNVAKVIWIDALCIDQSHVEERSRQVALMFQIYRHAQEVIAWLGKSYDNSDDAMMLLERWGSAIVENGMNDWKEVYQKSAWFRHQENVDKLIAGISDPFSERAWKALEHLYKRPYFCRLWIFQEWVLAKSISVMCGYMQLNGTYFVADCFFMLWKRALTESNLISSLEGARIVGMIEKSVSHEHIQANLLDLIYWRSLFQTSETSAFRRGRLLQLVSTVSRRRCLDPRDYIFAVAGLSQYGKEPIKVNYSLTVAETYIHFALSYITHPDLRIFAYAGIGLIDAYSHASDFPSWAPFWHGLGNDSSTRKVLNSKLFSTGFIEDLPYRLASQERTDTEVLMRGLFIDTIIEVLAGGSGWEAPEDQRWKGFIQTHERGQYFDNMPLLQAYFRTLLSDEWENVRLGKFSIEQEGAANLRLTSVMDLIVNFIRSYCVNYSGVDGPTISKFEDELQVSRDIPHLLGLGNFFAQEERPSEDRWLQSLESAQYSSKYFLSTVVSGRSLFRTTQGYIGTGPPLLEKGDMVYIFKNSYTPTLLRRHEERHRLVGEAFVLGLMDGEAKAYLQDEWRMQDITLY